MPKGAWGWLMCSSHLCKVARKVAGGASSSAVGNLREWPAAAASRADCGAGSRLRLGPKRGGRN